MYYPLKKIRKWRYCEGWRGRGVGGGWFDCSVRRWKVTCEIFQLFNYITIRRNPFALITTGILNRYKWIEVYFKN